MLVGYMRVSTTDDRQTVDLQRDALVATGVDHRHLHTDKASGARDDRPGLKACLDYLNAGDTLIVWKLDRLGRSLPHLLTIVTDLKARGIAFRSLTEQMDTTTPHGELLPIQLAVSLTYPAVAEPFRIRDLTSRCQFRYFVITWIFHVITNFEFFRHATAYIRFSFARPSPTA